MKIYAEDYNAAGRRYECTEQYMLENQGTETDPRTILVRDEEEKDYFEGLRFMLGHRLIVTTKLPAITNLLEDKVFYTFDTHETVIKGDHFVYRKWKS